MSQKRVKGLKEQQRVSVPTADIEINARLGEIPQSRHVDLTVILSRFP
jgi:hypothetical protein